LQEITKVKSMMKILCTALIGGLFFTSLAHAQTQSAYNGSDGSLLMPKAKPRGVVILMGGSNGRLGITGAGEITSLLGNQLIRTRQNYAASGFATLSLDSGASLPRAIEDMKKIARPVVVVATSRAATRAHRGSSADGIVLTSAMLDVFQSSASVSELPPILVIHHRQDSCRVTLPSLVDPFITWAQGKARVLWLTGGTDSGDPCEARGYHGFAGIDGQVVSAVSRFVSGTKPR
jgi:hypothetical protein